MTDPMPWDADDDEGPWAPARKPQYPTGDRICENCGDTNNVWHTDDATWNTLHPGGGGILCARCFMAIYDAIEGEQVWRIVPLPRDIETAVPLHDETGLAPDPRSGTARPLSPDNRPTDKEPK